MTRRCLVLGGGIAGLAAADRLVRAGIEVTLLEASDRLGGLGTFFEYDGRSWESFYHCVMPSDDDLLGLLREAGVAVRWTPTTMGMVVEGRRRPFNTALDLLRSRWLSPVQRVRFGLVSLLLRRLGRGRDLDHLRTEDWLRGLYGDTVWERLFVPLFGAKFGREFGDVPALYLWTRLGREGNVATRGYPVGGYRAVIAALRSGIERRGGVVCTDAEVLEVGPTDAGMRVRLTDGSEWTADHVVSTLPLPVLEGVAVPGLAARLPTVDLRYQGVVDVVVFLRRPLDGHYWSAVLHSGTEFDGVIESSTLMDASITGGRHLVHLMHYCDRTSPLFAEDPLDIAQRWTQALLELYPDLIGVEDVEAVRVFRAPFVEPVYPLGYGDVKPAAAVPEVPLTLATTAQVYPEITSWNSSVRLARGVADAVVQRLEAPVPLPRRPEPDGAPLGTTRSV